MVRVSVLSQQADPRERIADTLDPDADEQRWYCCERCGWACINPVGTIPEQNDLCLDCAVRQASPSDF